MDQLKAMATFVRIADEGGFTAASRALDASVPAVVRSLAALEASLGVRLFNRTTRRVAPTEEGRRYLEHCRQILAARSTKRGAPSAANRQRSRAR